MNIKRIITIALAAASVLYGNSVTARENVPMTHEKSVSGIHPNVAALMKKASGCAPATQQKELNINNVRTRILNGGDMWWDLQNAKYEIPKVSANQVSKNSLFAGALWIGGVAQGNLRLAAQTYRQSGNDYFPGPLVIGSASISAARCKDFDKIWKVSKAEVIQFSQEGQSQEVVQNNPDFLTWPGNGDVANGEAAVLAPFYNNIIWGYDSIAGKPIILNDNDPLVYEPEKGDFPSFDMDRRDNIPDQMIYIIYNDKGNTHLETGGLPIGLEIHTQAFAFSTSDELNNTTLYRNTIFNRGNETIDSCVFGQWVDPDLGNYIDDYVECDLSIDPVNNVPRSLGICYNGDDNDEGVLGYGLNPPSIGVRFFEGPKDKNNKELGMSKFVYYNNDFSSIGNPSAPEHYWNYLNGKWKDNKSITYGGNGVGGSDTASFMFPGKTDPAGRKEWTERTAGNPPGDRRFLQTSGPFSMLPGAVNRVTVGVVWARATTGGATGSFNLLKSASDRAYKLFKADFVNKQAPKAPDVVVTELNHQIILTLTNYKTIESFVDSFKGPCSTKTINKFQGYKIYQLKTNNAGADLSDPTQAKLIAQCDIQDEFARLTNVIRDLDLGQTYKQIMVDGENKGIRHTFSFTTDAFSTSSDRTLVNFQEYYFKVVSYANVVNCNIEEDQYTEGAQNVTASEVLVYKAIPHNTMPQGNGSVLNSTLDLGPEISRVEGIGNGGTAIRLTKATIEEALKAPLYAAKVPVYEKGYAPITVRVFDPFKVPLNTDFEVRLIDSSSYSLKKDSMSAERTYWYVKNMSTGDVIRSQVPVGYNNEQVIADWGIAISIATTIRPGNQDPQFDQSNGFISGEIEFSDPKNAWLTGIADEDPTFSSFTQFATPFNWIRSGSKGKNNNFSNPSTDDFGLGGRGIDEGKTYAHILGGTWAPYALAARATAADPSNATQGPAYAATQGASNDNPLSDLMSVDIVFTRDKTKWTRCIVVETGENSALNIGGAEKFDLRASPSVDQFGMPDKTAYNATGMSWFPGYAINVETGERLNIIFGEDSSQPLDNGDDMMWNPTNSYIQKGTGILSFGGKHHIYVMGNKPFKLGFNTYNGPRYDEGKSYVDVMKNSSSKLVAKRTIMSQAMWVTMPIATGIQSPWNGTIPNETTVRLRVKHTYAKFKNNAMDSVLQNDSMPLYRFSTGSFAPTMNDAAAKKSALDMINVSPNPYYAYSGYENPNNQLDNNVRIINLPAKCTVSIYTMNGFLVRRFHKDDATTTYLNWNLKNDANVPIASGVYLIHIDAPGMGERVIKWFGIMRPADFDTF